MADNPHNSDLTEKVERVWERTRKALEKGRTELLKISKVGKIKFDTSKMQRDRSVLFQRLGEITYASLKEGRFSPNDVQDFITRIDQLNEKIETHKADMRAKARANNR